MAMTPQMQAVREQAERNGWKFVATEGVSVLCMNDQTLAVQMTVFWFNDVLCAVRYDHAHLMAGLVEDPNWMPEPDAPEFRTPLEAMGKLLEINGGS